MVLLAYIQLRNAGDNHTHRPLRRSSDASAEPQASHASDVDINLIRNCCWSGWTSSPEGRPLFMADAITAWLTSLLTHILNGVQSAGLRGDFHLMTTGRRTSGLPWARPVCDRGTSRRVTNFATIREILDSTQLKRPFLWHPPTAGWLRHARVPYYWLPSAPQQHELRRPGQKRPWADLVFRPEWRAESHSSMVVLGTPTCRVAAMAPGSRFIDQFVATLQQAVAVGRLGHYR